MSTSIQEYKNELLGGDFFLQQFGPQLDELFQDEDFLQLVSNIYSQAQEADGDIASEKNIAKTVLFNQGAYFKFSSYKYIVDTVKNQGYAQNSAAISTYCVMRMRQEESYAPPKADERVSIFDNEISSEESINTATFIGTEKEFHDFIGPRLRNKVQTLTKPAKTAANNTCQHCGKIASRLDAAHIHGRERKEIIKLLLSEYCEDGLYKVDLHKFEQDFINEHYPIDENFLFLCRDCHRRYDQESEEKTLAESKVFVEENFTEKRHVDVDHNKFDINLGRKEEKEMNETESVAETLNDNQIRRLLGSVGKWFFVKYFQEAYSNRDDKKALIDLLYNEGFDKDISGTTTRVNCMIRIIDSGCSQEAFRIIEDSDRMHIDHPELSKLLAEIYASHPEFEI